MEKDNLFMNESINSASATAAAPTWNSCNFSMEIHSNDQLTNSFFIPNWGNSMDQSDPFESALSSIVSSPVASNASVIPPSPAAGDNVMIRELIGRLGNICNSGEISPQSYLQQVHNNNNNSTNTSCYGTPLNSPPRLNLSKMDSQIRGNLLIPGNHLLNHPNLAALAADPGFAERAARLSCFSNKNFGGLNGLNEIELSQRLIQRPESAGKLSRVSSNQSMKVAGSHQENTNNNTNLPPQDGNSGSDKKFSRLSRSSTPENAEFGDSKEESSVSEQIPGGDLSLKSQNDVNARKRKSIPRGKAKAKETPSSTNDAKVVAENEESNSKRSKQDETSSNQNDGNQKQNKDNSKPPEPPKDYIHVRARRGQATDSHSLAERVRREKISERMKFLQDLVPGCNKVTGKAVMLDEIINYVQSLQRQVEFLSMKLTTVNPRMDLNMEALLSKDMYQSRGSVQHSIYQIDDSAARTFPFGYQNQQQQQQQDTQFSINPINLNSLFHGNPNMQLPPINGNSEDGSEVALLWEDDLQSLVQMGFNQNQPHNFNGSNSIATAQVKIEM